MKHKNKNTCFSYVVLPRNHHDISIGISTRNGHVCFSCAYAYVAVMPTEDNIRKTSVFVQSSDASCLMFMLRLLLFSLASRLWSCLCLCASENQPSKISVLLVLMLMRTLILMSR